MSEMNLNSLQSLFKFPLEGKETRNRFIIGSALVFASQIIPIIPLLFVGGYMIVIMRQVIAGDRPTLPEWTDWGQLAIDGLKTGVIGLVYMLPAIIVYIGGMVLYFASFAPLFALSAEESAEALLALSSMSTLGGLTVFFVALALGMLLILLASIIMPVAWAHFAATGELKAGFSRREWWPILRRVKLSYFIAWVIILGLFTVLYMGILVGYYSLICCIIVPFVSAPATYYVMLVGGALFAEVYREGVETEADVAAEALEAPAEGADE